MKELISIQKELDVPKNHVNSFGKYNYRTCEDILEAVKPLCEKFRCVLTLSDEIKHIGERYYVVATATLTNEEKEVVSCSASAREEEVKKGMDASQITGSASSYARKYALNGLFCIDDSKDDPDSKDNKDKPLIEQLSDMRIELVNLLKKNRNWEVQLLERYGLTSLEDLTESQVIESHGAFKAKGFIV